MVEDNSSDGYYYNEPDYDDDYDPNLDEFTEYKNHPPRVQKLWNNLITSRAGKVIFVTLLAVSVAGGYFTMDRRGDLPEPTPITISAPENSNFGATASLVTPEEEQSGGFLPGATSTATNEPDERPTEVVATSTAVFTPAETLSPPTHTPTTEPFTVTPVSTETREEIQAEFTINGERPTHPVTGELLDSNDFFIQKLYPHGLTTGETDFYHDHGGYYAVMVIFGPGDVRPLAAILEGDGNEYRDARDFTTVSNLTADKMMLTKERKAKDTDEKPYLGSISFVMDGYPPFGVQARAIEYHIVYGPDGKRTNFFQIYSIDFENGDDPNEFRVFYLGVPGASFAIPK